jgi:hypothetical protein
MTVRSVDHRASASTPNDTTTHQIQDLMSAKGDPGNSA